MSKIRDVFASIAEITGYLESLVIAGHPPEYLQVPEQEDRRYCVTDSNESIVQR